MIVQKWYMLSTNQNCFHWKHCIQSSDWLLDLGLLILYFPCFICSQVLPPLAFCSALAVHREGIDVLRNDTWLFPDTWTIPLKFAPWRKPPSHLKCAGQASVTFTVSPLRLLPLLSLKDLQGESRSPSHFNIPATWGWIWGCLQAGRMQMHSRQSDSRASWHRFSVSPWASPVRCTEVSARCYAWASLWVALSSSLHLLHD